MGIGSMGIGNIWLWQHCVAVVLFVRITDNFICLENFQIMVVKN